jgi:choline kinase
VNFEVPDNSIVMGNLARIIPNESATEGYINRTVLNYQIKNFNHKIIKFHWLPIVLEEVISKELKQMKNRFEILLNRKSEETKKGDLSNELQTFGYN